MLPSRRGETTRSDLVWQRVGAASGAIAVVLNLIGALLGDPYRSGLNPDPTDASASIARALTAVREEARLGATLSLMGAFFLIWFAAYLRRHLLAFEGRAGWMASAAFGGGLVAAALLLVSVSITLAATEITAYGEDTVVAKVFLTHGWNYFYVLSPPVMALVAASSLLGLRFRALPRWLSILGLLLVLVPFVTGAGLGAMLGLLWILPTSDVLTIRAGRSDQRSE